MWHEALLKGLQLGIVENLLREHLGENRRVRAVHRQVVQQREAVVVVQLSHDAIARDAYLPKHCTGYRLT
jgi:hypothetical protein